MKEIIRQLKTLLVCDQFVVTGSYALNKFGLSEKVGDLDIIIVNPTEEAIGIIKRMSEEFPAPTKFNYPTTGSIFMMNGVKVDAFIKKEKVATEITIDGVLFATPIHIIKAKKSINRIKDWIQLRKIAKLIYDQNEFNAFLDKQ